MHITLEADYAIRIVSQLAKEKARQDAKTISEKTDVSLRFALKILRKFVAGGIVKSFKGAQGGYELAKAPQDISLREAIEVIEGEYFISRCLSPEHDCARNSDASCKVHTIFAKISNYVQMELEKVTFDQLI